MSDATSGVYETSPLDGLELELTPEQEEQVATVVEFALEDADESIDPELLAAIIDRVLGRLDAGHPLYAPATSVLERGLAAMQRAEESLA